MKICCLFSLFPDIENDIKRSKAPNPVSSHHVQMNVVDGLIANGCDVIIINTPRLRSYPDYPKIFFHKCFFSYNGKQENVHIGFINLSGLNLITEIIHNFFAIKHVLKEEKIGQKVVLLTYNSYIQIMVPMLMARRLYPDRLVLCDMIGDIHGQYGIVNPTKGFKGVLIRWVNRLEDCLASKFDTFALCTEPIAEALGVKEKPHCVVEGIYTIAKPFLEDNDQSMIKTIFYAGALIKEYGIRHLLNAFTQIKHENYVLEIAGNGDEAELVQQYSQQYPRIHYLGILTPMQVAEHQKKATVLVNPRVFSGEFVKYSFASKNLECLASGKPYVAHYLPCNPPEYDEVVLYPKDESDVALAEKLEEVCELSERERNKLAEKAYKFILKQKNPRVQCEKIVKMIKSIIGETS